MQFSKGAVYLYTDTNMNCKFITEMVYLYTDIGRLQLKRSGTWPKVALPAKLNTVLLSSFPPVLLSSCPPFLLSSCLTVLLSSFLPFLFSPYPPVLISFCPHVLMSSCPPVLLSLCPPVLLSLCPPVILSSVLLSVYKYTLFVLNLQLIDADFKEISCSRQYLKKIMSDK